MKIAFLKSQLQKRGGLEKYTQRLAQSFATSGHDVHILTTDCPEDAFSSASFNVVSFGKKISPSLFELLRFDKACKSYVKEHKPDVVFGMERNFCLQTHYRAGNGCHAAYLERRRQTDSWLKSFSFSVNPLHKLILQMEKKTFESTELKKLFVNSYMVQKEICSHYPKVDPSKIVVVHNGVEWKELQMPFEEGLNMRAKVMHSLGLDPGCFQFLFVGNEYGRKGLSRLLQALSCLKDKNWQASIIGKERNPEPFIQEASDLRLDHKVKFFGAVNEMKTFYSAADALVIPSLYDPFANVTVEGLAMGLRVISSTDNGGSEVITSDALGSLFTTTDELIACLDDAMCYSKTHEQATSIRDQVAHLDFSNQIAKIQSLVQN